MSPDLERRISDALGNPTRDPHGELIPSSTLSMPLETSVSLDSLGIGDEATVQRVESRDPDALQQFDRLGILIGSKLRLLDRSGVDQLLTLRVGKRKGNVTLGPALSGRIYVERSIVSHATGQRG